jgi:hypothetical protein
MAKVQQLSADNAVLRRQIEMLQQEKDRLCVLYFWYTESFDDDKCLRFLGYDPMGEMRTFSRWRQEIVARGRRLTEASEVQS